MTEMLIENFCPIHSFVLDRNLVDPSDLFFEERISRLEDYDFFLRICSKYPTWFESRSRVTAVYNWRFGKTKGVDEEWSHARRHIWRLKCQIRDRA